MMSERAMELPVVVTANVPRHRRGSARQVAGSVKLWAGEISRAPCTDAHDLDGLSAPGVFKATSSPSAASPVRPAARSS
jgi:hypothetical protein